MTEYDWETTYNRGVELYGNTPGPQLEQDLLEHFADNPTRFVAQLEHLGKQIRNGADIADGWPILRKRLRDTTNRAVTATDQQHQAKLVQHARAFITNTGVYNNEQQIREDIKDRGIKDQDRVDELIAFWREEQQTMLRRRSEQEQQTEPSPSMPNWVKRWQRARAAGDQRLFPEQEPGIIQLHQIHLAESSCYPKPTAKTYRGPGVKVSGYEHELVLLTADHSNAEVFVQPGEYGDDGEAEPKPF